MIKHCVHAVFNRSQNWLQVIRSLHFCVPLQAKPDVSMCSHPSQSSSDQERATLSQEASLAAPGIAAKSDVSLQRNVQTQIIPLPLLLLATSRAHPQSTTPVLSAPFCVLQPGV